MIFVNFVDFDSAWENVNNLNGAVKRDNPDVSDPLLEGILFKDVRCELQPMGSKNNTVEFQAKARIVTGRHKF